MSLESLSVADSLAGVDRDEWNALAGEQPFVRHEFFSALLESGSAAAATGWRPQFLLLRRAGTLTGAMPLFAKTHSYGEYVFDWAWADAHERHGVEYYPKLLCAVPFTPVRGNRILGEQEPLIRAALEIGKSFSSLHVLFAPDEEAMRLKGTTCCSGARCSSTGRTRATPTSRVSLRGSRMRGTEHRQGAAGYARRDLRVLEGGRSRRRTGGSLSPPPPHLRAHRSSPYLNLDFFLRIGHTLTQNMVLVLAERDGHAVASSLLIRDEKTLYGRYWGALEHVPLLHFECCYYQAIEYAILRKLEVFEGGAQGEHKIFRGLLPVETLSAHWLAHPRFARAVELFLEREGAGIARYVNELADHSPFKNREEK
jgi:predicted N-acyltransferase